MARTYEDVNVPGFWDLVNREKPAREKKEPATCRSGHKHLSAEWAARCDERHPAPTDRAPDAKGTP